VETLNVPPVHITSTVVKHFMRAMYEVRIYAILWIRRYRGNNSTDQACHPFISDVRASKRFTSIRVEISIAPGSGEVKCYLEVMAGNRGGLQFSCASRFHWIWNSPSGHSNDSPPAW